MQLNQYYQTLYYRGISASGMKAMKEVLAHALFPKASLSDKKQEGFQVAETGYLRYRDAFFFGEHTKPLAPPPPTKEAAIKAYQIWAKKSQENLEIFAKKDKTKYPDLFRYLQLRQAEAIYNEKNKNLSHWKLYFAVELRVLVPIRRSSRYPDIAPSAMQDDWEIPLEYLAFAQKVKTAPLERENVTVYVGSNGIIVGLDYEHLPLETSTETELWEVVQVEENPKLYNFVFARMANGLVALHYPVANIEKIALRTAEGLKTNWNEAGVKMPAMSEVKEPEIKVPACKEAVESSNTQNTETSAINVERAILSLTTRMQKVDITKTKEDAKAFLVRKLIMELEEKTGMRLEINSAYYIIIKDKNYAKPMSMLFHNHLYKLLTDMDNPIEVTADFQEGRKTQLNICPEAGETGGWLLILNLPEIYFKMRLTSIDLDEDAMGFAMHFLHESGHINYKNKAGVANGHTEDTGREGAIEKTLVNPIRKELSKGLGSDFGQRLAYLELEVNIGGDSKKYLPFSKETLDALLSNQIPTKSFVAYNEQQRAIPKDEDFF